MAQMGSEVKPRAVYAGDARRSSPVLDLFQTLISHRAAHTHPRRRGDREEQQTPNDPSDDTPRGQHRGRKGG
jgi:hypothetical protein